MQSAAINIHAESLYYAAQLTDGLIQQAWVTVCECYLNKHRPHFPTLLRKCYQFLSQTKETQNFV